MTGRTDLDDLQEHSLTLELGALAHAADAPPSRVDIPAAVQSGRRLRRRRRRVRLGATALALTAVTVGALLAGPGHAPTPVPADVQRGPADGWQGPARWHLPGRVDPHDPIRSTAQFGWLPPGAGAKGYTQTGWRSDALASGKAAPGAEMRETFRLFVYPRGVDPAVKGARDPAMKYRLPAPDVNGRRAYWATSNAGQPVSTMESLLRWQSADGRWVELTAQYVPVPGQERTLLRIAASATVADSAVPVPVSITDLPEGSTGDDSGFGMDNWLSDDTSDTNWSVAIGWQLHGYDISLTAAPYTEATDQQLRQLASHEQQACETVKGLDVCLTHNGPDKAPAALTAVGGLKGLLKHVRVFGLDPANWTTHVLP
ncbi:hypothetical protein [Streptacidiphilus jiangxiensis]|uniref:Uncharacterized protein n=1 Tax=Streptacidiphilus jiangxiensis TaxID=235985 RepID=A0A1H7S5B6_STRJI|nr:hypothetical protein [Streptacidiphilus jiangxiensis]SEL67446.1 hypothetical protein SAMN05414137_111151 [Streptacidiphilus jiangxiensis]